MWPLVPPTRDCSWDNFSAGKEPEWAKIARGAVAAASRTVNVFGFNFQSR